MPGVLRALALKVFAPYVAVLMVQVKSSRKVSCDADMHDLTAVKELSSRMHRGRRREKPTRCTDFEESGCFSVS